MADGKSLLSIKETEWKEPEEQPTGAVLPKTTTTVTSSGGSTSATSTQGESYGSIQDRYVSRRSGGRVTQSGTSKTTTTTSSVPQTTATQTVTDADKLMAQVSQQTGGAVSGTVDYDQAKATIDAQKTTQVSSSSTPQVTQTYSSTAEKLAATKQAVQSGDVVGAIQATTSQVVLPKKTNIAVSSKTTSNVVTDAEKLLNQISKTVVDPVVAQTFKTEAGAISQRSATGVTATKVNTYTGKTTTEKVTVDSQVMNDLKNEIGSGKVYDQGSLPAYIPIGYEVRKVSVDTGSAVTQYIVAKKGDALAVEQRLKKQVYESNYMKAVQAIHAKGRTTTVPVQTDADNLLARIDSVLGTETGPKETQIDYAKTVTGKSSVDVGEFSKIENIINFTDKIPYLTTVTNKYGATRVKYVGPKTVEPKSVIGHVPMPISVPPIKSISYGKSPLSIKETVWKEPDVAPTKAATPETYGTGMALTGKNQIAQVIGYDTAKDLGQASDAFYKAEKNINTFINSNLPKSAFIDIGQGPIPYGLAVIQLKSLSKQYHQTGLELSKQESEFFNLGMKIESDWHPDTTAVFNKEKGQWEINFPYQGAERYGQVKRNLEEAGFLGWLATGFTGADFMGIPSTVDVIMGDVDKAVDRKVRAVLSSQEGFVSFALQMPTTQYALAFGAGSVIGIGSKAATGYLSASGSFGKLAAFKAGELLVGGTLVGLAAYDVEQTFANVGVSEGFGKLAQTGVVFGGGYAGYQYGSTVKFKGLTAQEWGGYKGFKKAVGKMEKGVKFYDPVTDTTTIDMITEAKKGELLGYVEARKNLVQGFYKQAGKTGYQDTDLVLSNARSLTQTFEGQPLKGQAEMIDYVGAYGKSGQKLVMFTGGIAEAKGSTHDIDLMVSNLAKGQRQLARASEHLGVEYISGKKIFSDVAYYDMPIYGEGWKKAFDIKAYIGEGRATGSGRLQTVRDVDVITESGFRKIGDIESFKRHSDSAVELGHTRRYKDFESAEKLAMKLFEGFGEPENLRGSLEAFLEASEKLGKEPMVAGEKTAKLYEQNWSKKWAALKNKVYKEALPQNLRYWLEVRNFEKIYGKRDIDKIGGDVIESVGKDKGVTDIVEQTGVKTGALVESKISEGGLPDYTSSMYKNVVEFADSLISSTTSESLMSSQIGGQYGSSIQSKSIESLVIDSGTSKQKIVDTSMIQSKTVESGTSKTILSDISSSKTSTIGSSKTSQIYDNKIYDSSKIVDSKIYDQGKIIDSKTSKVNKLVDSVIKQDISKIGKGKAIKIISFDSGKQVLPQESKTILDSIIPVKSEKQQSLIPIVIPQKTIPQKKIVQSQSYGSSTMYPYTVETIGAPIIPYGLEGGGSPMFARLFFGQRYKFRGYKLPSPFKGLKKIKYKW